MTAPDSAVVYAEGPWAHRAVSANGARFHVVEYGDGPLVLLLHGFPEFWWCWRHQLIALGEAGYRAVAMDLRGYGASDRPPRGYDPFTLTADIAGVIRSLGEPDAAVVGHDWGAFVGWTAAALQPKVVRRLVAVSMPHPRRLRTALATDPRQIAKSTYVFAFQTPLAPERVLARHDGAFVEKLLERWSGPGWPDPESSWRYRKAMQIPGTAHCSLEFYRWAIRSLPRPDGMAFAQRLKNPLQVPTLHTHGALDACLLPRTARGSSRYVEAPYRWRLFEGAGHFPHEEIPQTFNAELLGWLADPEPDR
ncbi:MAG: alpha/beta fold hydrolase [Carbonactinosporaceae bacterium]